MAHPISVENAAAFPHFRHSWSATAAATAGRLSMSGHSALGQVRDIQTRHRVLHDWRGGVGTERLKNASLPRAKKVLDSAHFAAMYVCRSQAPLYLGYLRDVSNSGYSFYLGFDYHPYIISS
jgi:hypothetical protein